MKKNIMEDNKKFPEQEAPIKNTDNVFVRVGEDGQPVMPHTDEAKSDLGSEEEPTTLDKS